MPTDPRPFIPVPLVCKLELIYDQNGQVCENVVYVRGGDSWSSSDVQELAEEAIVAWDATLGTITNANTTLTMVRTTSMETFPGPQYEAPSAATGAIAGASLPGNVTVATKFSGGVTGRSTRGRAYFVGLAGVDYVGNQLGTGVADLITDAWHDFFAAIFASVHNAPQHVVVSFVEDDLWRSEGLVTLVTSYSTENNIDSQRRRLTGRGL